MSDLERVIGDAIADGRMSEDDADIVREFGEFLTKLPPHGDRSREAVAQRRRALIEHAEFCGLSPEDVEGLRQAEGER